jgi:hypothetical protein
MTIPTQTEIQKKRAVWWAEHVKLDMSFSDFVHLNEECRELFPTTNEEREQKTRDLEAMPEFVL